MVTFGDGALDSMVDVVSRIPAGYVVGLFTDPETTSAYVPDDYDFVAGIDHVFLSADESGVTAQPLDDMGDHHGEPVTISWTDLQRIHIY